MIANGIGWEDDMEGLGPLVTASALFVGSHFLLSHPARIWLVSRLGEKSFLGFYSLVALALFGWMIWTFRNAPSGPTYWAPTDTIWIVASILTLLASILFVGSLQRNPAFPDPDGDVVHSLAARVPTGVFRVTRHPMMWGFTFWGLSHILVAPRMDVFIFVGSIVFLALFGAFGQDRRKEAALGDAWAKWERQTSFLPRLTQLIKIEPRNLLIGVVFWLVATWAHNLFGNYGAGIYRWL
ncbi:MAG: NnrU family protein [Sphingorhabdus sp.]